MSLFRTAYFLPAVTSAVATALVWNMIYGRETGILNFLLERLGMQPVCWLCTDNAMYVGGHRQHLGRDRRRDDHLPGGSDGHSA